MTKIPSFNKDTKPNSSNDKQPVKPKKGYEINLSAKGNQRFKDFQNKRNGSKFVITRPR